jgi:nucleotide-binding universal stress UspA family protein
MPFKDLLVHVDSSRHCKRRVELATTLARRFDAYLTGLYVMPPASLSPLLADQFPPELQEEADAHAAQQRDQAKALFDAATGGLSSRALWVEGEGDTADVVALEARVSDFTILGQVDPDEAASGKGAFLPERIVMASGRPALFVPYAGRFEKIGERVLIAWNGSPQSSRAVKDAMPFLKGAHHIEVLTITSHHGDATQDRASADGLIQHLARHGVLAQGHHLTADNVDAGDLLLSRAADEAADLVVMGVYGHSRLRELVLGGVSRVFFERMTVPVFMAH